MYLVTILCFMGLLTSSLAIDCMSDSNNKCLTKAQLPSTFASLVQGGDPCFLASGTRFCFVTTTGSMNKCTCKAECGCTTAFPSVPLCDNSVVPINPNCSADKTTYCPIVLKGQMNTRCIYCGVDVAACNKVCVRNLTPEDITVILNAHNTLRRKVAKGLETRGVGGGQPKAANMYELVWDNELAASAQRWADQCEDGHDRNRLIVGYTYVGQNIANSWSSVNTPDKDLWDKINGWYDEVSDWPSANVGSFTTSGSTGQIGQYTQLVWAQTKRVGCGYISNLDNNNPSYIYKQTLVCNYALGGNMVGAQVYVATTGTPGSQCPNGVNDGLCKQ